MKLLIGELTTILGNRGPRPRLGVLVRFLVILFVMVAVYAVVFRFLMAREGQDQTWVTSFYWVLTVMSTLGFGDITFHTDAGRLFSILVLMSGMLFLLVLLPFIFIEFFYQPWMAAQAAARAPRSLKEGTRGHVIITHLDAVTESLIGRLERYHHKYVLLVSDTNEAIELLDQGFRVAVGSTGDPETYRALRVDDADMVVATGSDAANTLIASTIREVSSKVRIIATADDAASIDILMLADCHEVIHLPSMMAASLARRVAGGNRTHPIGNFGQLVIAEANTQGTSLAGKTLLESGVRVQTGVGVIGVWKRGAFEPAGPDTLMTENSVLLLAGTSEQLANYDDVFADESEPESLVLVLGGGRVGWLTARALEQRGIAYRVVERDPTRPGQNEHWLIGNAAELSVLKEAGIDEATTVVITTHDDDTNVYLALYSRKLRPPAQILSRATEQRHVASIHRAGADFVLSFASIGASMLFNLLEVGTVMIVADGLNLFRVEIPRALDGKTLADSSIRARTGATVVAFEDEQGNQTINPPAGFRLTGGTRLILVGSVEAEQRFIESFGH